MSPSADERSEVRRLSRDQENYKWRAYMSSALTNVEGERRSLLCNMLEKLYLEVFHPLEVFLYLPHLWSDPGHDAAMPSRDVHLLDRLRIAESDFLVLCADEPSFGVGQEFEIAQAAGLQVLPFKRRGVQVSRMLLGGMAFHYPCGVEIPSESNTFIVYDDFTDLVRQLRARTVALVALLKQRGRDRVPMPILGVRLQAILRRRGMSVEELARATGFTEEFLRFLLASVETYRTVLDSWELPDFDQSVDLTKYTNPGLWVIRKLCRALNIGIEELVEADNVSAEMAEAREVDRRLREVVESVALEENATVSEIAQLTRDSSLKVGARQLLAARSGEKDLRILEQRCRGLLNSIRGSNRE